MQLPTVSTSFHDEKLNYTFEVLAYRKLTQAELMQAWAVYRGSKQGRKKLKKGTRVQVISVIGARD